MCSKVKHRTRDIAMIARRRTGNRLDMEPYFCGQCKAWHLRHSHKDYKVQMRIDQLLGKRK